MQYFSSKGVEKMKNNIVVTMKTFSKYAVKKIGIRFLIVQVNEFSKHYNVCSKNRVNIFPQFLWWEMFDEFQWKKCNSDYDYCPSISIFQVLYCRMTRKLVRKDRKCWLFQFGKDRFNNKKCYYWSISILRVLYWRITRKLVRNVSTKNIIMFLRKI